MKVGDLLAGLKAYRAKLRERTDAVLIQVESFYESEYSFYNLGLLSIGTYLKHFGFSVQCVSACHLFFMNREMRQTMFENYMAKLSGFYVNSDNIGTVVHFAKELKSWVPDTKIVLGGPLVTIMGAEILNLSDVFDFAVPGEGEIPMLELCRHYRDGSVRLEDIPSLMYREEGNVRVNPRVPAFQDLDELPPIDYSLISPSRGITYSSGRGCPFRCSFCFQEVHGKGYRYFSASRVVSDLISTMEKYKLIFVSIVDDTFIADPVRAMDICTGLREEKKKRGLDFGIFCEGRVDTFSRHPELIPALIEAGVIRLQIGVETGSQEILDLYNKRITLQQIEDVTADIASHGPVSFYGNMILGGPKESRETFEKSLEFAKKLLRIAPGMYETGSSFLALYPGTDISKNPDKYGLRPIDTQWETSISLTAPSALSENLSFQETVDLKFIFMDEIRKVMLEIIRELPFETVERHFYMNKKYFLTSFYYQVMSSIPIMSDYFDLKKSRAFYRLDDVLQTDVKSWYPMRLIQDRPFHPDGDGYVLAKFLDPVFITDPAEMAVYDYASGKFPIGWIAQILAEKLPGNRTPDEVIENVMIPLYRRLEKTYHIIFYR